MDVATVELHDLDGDGVVPVLGGWFRVVDRLVSAGPGVAQSKS